MKAAEMFSPCSSVGASWVKRRKSPTPVNLGASPQSSKVMAPKRFPLLFPAAKLLNQIPPKAPQKTLGYHKTKVS